MSLTQFFSGMGSQLHELLWRDLPEQTSTEEIDYLESRLRESETTLTHQHARLQKLRSQVAQRECRSRWLEERVEIYLNVGDQTNAWRHALDLDHVRQSLETDRAQLAHHRQAHHDELRRHQHLRNQLTELQVKFLS